MEKAILKEMYPYPYVVPGGSGAKTSDLMIKALERLVPYMAPRTKQGEPSVRKWAYKGQVGQEYFEDNKSFFDQDILGKGAGNQQQPSGSGSHAASRQEP